MPVGTVTRVPGVTPKQVWQALRDAGASPTQAIGIMANWINESELDPESYALDTNGFYSYGLASWNAKSYPGAAGLITGHPAADLKTQVAYAAQTGAFTAANGATPAEAAANYAKNYERCTTCQPGGAQYQARVANAQTVFGWAAFGNWPRTVSASAVSDRRVPQQASQDCLIGFGGIPGTSFINDIFGSGGNLGQACLFTRSEARAVVGALLLVPAGVAAIVGLLVLASAGLGASGAGKTAEKVAAAVPGGSRVIRAGSTQRRSPGRTETVRETRVGKPLSEDEVKRAQSNRRKLDAARKKEAAAEKPKASVPAPRVVGPARGRQPGDPFRYAGKPRPEPA